jgi:hypothetical protein
MIDDEERREVPQNGLLVDLVRPGQGLIAVFGMEKDCEVGVRVGGGGVGVDDGNERLLRELREKNEEIEKLKELLRVHESR